MILPGVSKQLLYYFVKMLGEADCHIALLTKQANIDPDTGVFDGTGEIKAQGYTTGGKRLSNFVCGLDDGIAWASWGNPEWTNATIRACGAVIYAKGMGNKIISVHTFPEEQTSSQGTFRVKMPPPGAAGAVFWLS